MAEAAGLPDFNEFLAVYMEPSKRGKTARLLQSNSLNPFKNTLKKLYEGIVANYGNDIGTSLSSIPMMMRKFLASYNAQQGLTSAANQTKPLFNADILGKMIEAGFFTEPRKAAIDLRTASNILPPTQLGYDIWKQHPHKFDFPGIDAGDTMNEYSTLLYSYELWRADNRPKIAREFGITDPNKVDTLIKVHLTPAKLRTEFNKAMRNDTLRTDFLAWLSEGEQTAQELTANEFATNIYDKRIGDLFGKETSRSRMLSRTKDTENPISQQDAMKLYRQLLSMGKANEPEADRGRAIANF